MSFWNPSPWHHLLGDTLVQPFNSSIVLFATAAQISLCPKTLLAQSLAVSLLSITKTLLNKTLCLEGRAQQAGAKSKHLSYVEAPRNSGTYPTIHNHCPLPLKSIISPCPIGAPVQQEGGKRQHWVRKIKHMKLLEVYFCWKVNRGKTLKFCLLKFCLPLPHCKSHKVPGQSKVLSCQVAISRKQDSAVIFMQFKSSWNSFTTGLGRTVPVLCQQAPVLQGMSLDIWQLDTGKSELDQ